MLDGTSVEKCRSILFDYSTSVFPDTRRHFRLLDLKCFKWSWIGGSAFLFIGFTYVRPMYKVWVVRNLLASHTAIQ